MLWKHRLLVVLFSLCLPSAAAVIRWRKYVLRTDVMYSAPEPWAG